MFTTITEAEAVGAATVDYGLFLIVVIDILIIAFVIFMTMRQVNKAEERRQTVAVPNALT